ncbi:cyclic nucleotide-binding domain-containing protein [Parvibium lacunae]|uniref:Cyclic nucleotide-binding domain-containing protein n=1 Tax=Parvibium lacunae TaxID=1888893 RepID=A0A368KZL8_9BURK|nr:cyclic nucleotide-binding domain-containing protein [Parvibium lacunae]RCS56757.1 cyclic nucleotide-binding domain-containing protein [Parvibium lacunae]
MTQPPHSSQDSLLPRDRLLQLGAKPLGSAVTFADQVFALAQRVPLLADFSVEEIQTLTSYMEAFHAPSGCMFIEEGALDDYMVLIIRGTVEVVKLDNWGHRSRVAIVTPVQTLGEMSMVDGEPRFASCIAMEECHFGVLSRSKLLQLIDQQPQVGAKLLLRLVQLLSSRLRQTSAKLMAYMSQQTPSASR